MHLRPPPPQPPSRGPRLAEGRWVTGGMSDSDEDAPAMMADDEPRLTGTWREDGVQTGFGP